MIFINEKNLSDIKRVIDVLENGGYKGKIKIILNEDIEKEITKGQVITGIEKQYRIKKIFGHETVLISYNE